MVNFKIIINISRKNNDNGYRYEKINPFQSGERIHIKDIKIKHRLRIFLQRIRKSRLCQGLYS